MVATKATLTMKQYVKAKPTKWGLKSFVLADVNGFTVDYRLYTGKTQGAIWGVATLSTVTIFTPALSCSII